MARLPHSSQHVETKHRKCFVPFFRWISVRRAPTLAAPPCDMNVCYSMTEEKVLKKKSDESRRPNKHLQRSPVIRLQTAAALESEHSAESVTLKCAFKTALDETTGKRGYWVKRPQQSPTDFLPLMLLLAFAHLLKFRVIAVRNQR